MNKFNKSLELNKTSRVSLVQEMQRITPMKKQRFEDFCNKYKSFTESNVSYEVPLCFNSDSSDESDRESASDDVRTVYEEKIQRNPRSPTKPMKAIKRKVTAESKKTTKRIKVDSSPRQDKRRDSFGDWSPENLKKYIEVDMKSNFMQLLVRRNVIRLLDLEFLEDAQTALAQEIKRLKPHVNEKDLLLYVENRAKSRCIDRLKLSKSQFKKVLIGRAHSTTFDEFYEWNRKLLVKWDYLTREIDLEDMLMYSTELLQQHYKSACSVCHASVH